MSRAEEYVGRRAVLKWELCDLPPGRLAGPAAAHGRVPVRQKARRHFLGRVRCCTQTSMLGKELLNN